MTRPSLTRYAWLSIAAAVLTIILKAGAYWLTGSVGLLSDAIESVVNLVAAIGALVALTIAARPADAEHPYGHEKAEYFSASAEGAMIVIAALGISAAAVERLMNPQPLAHLGLGLGVSAVAALVNLGVARVLFVAGRSHRSITLLADAHHLMTDVWTSAGVLVGVGAVALTGWAWLDPAVALAVAVNVAWTGVSLVRRSMQGLMDSALPAAEQAIIRGVLEQYHGQGIRYHALRTRGSGARRFAQMHLLVPGSWTVQRGHDLAEKIEAQIHEQLAGATLLIHLEPLEDPASWRDTELDRTSVG
jgi:cation diffusion facilitator family transporter